MADSVGIRCAVGQDEAFVGHSAIVSMVAMTLLLGVMTLAIFHSYLFFHLLVEIFSIVVACGIFMVAWHSRRFSDNPYFLFLGIAYPFIAFVDLCHTITYESMGVFLRAGPHVHPGADPAIEFWIAGRYLEAGSLLLSVFFLRRRFNPYLMGGLYTIITAAIFLSIYQFGLFPACFIVPGSGSGAGEAGLTTFKVASEYVVVAILLVAYLLLRRRRDCLDPSVFRLVALGMVATGLAELSFTLYSDMFGIFNILGHYLKVASFFLLYRATIQTGLEEPYRVLFRNMKLSEEASRRERDFIDAVLQVEAALVLVLDGAGRAVRVNRAFEEVTGFGLDDLRDRPFWEVIHPPAEREEMAAFYQAMVERSETTAREETILTRDGGERLIDWSNAVMGADDAQGRYVIATGIDRTERRRAEATLLLTEQQVAVADLAAGVAHHYNNLHSGIIGHLDLLQAMSELPEKEKTWLGRVRDNMIRASRITDSLLTFSGQRIGDSREIDLNRQIRGLSLLLEETCREESIEITLDLDESVPTLVGDPMDINQILLNLGTNGWQAMVGAPERTLTFRTRKVDSEVLLEVVDTGCGIPQEERGRIFHPMYSLKGEHAPIGSPMIAVRGTGMGLSITARLVAKLGGTVEVESEVGKGTAMRVHLPCPPDEADEAGEAGE